MAYSVIVPRAISAQNVDAWNRSIVSASDLENGFGVKLNAKSATAEETEVWTATAPATSALGGCWMVWNPEIVDTDGRFRGIDPDPRNYILKAGKVGNAFKLQVGDLILATADALAGTKSSNTYVEATNGVFEWTWVASPTAGSTAFKLVGTEYISIADGTIGNQRIVAYLFDCVQA